MGGQADAKAAGEWPSLGTGGSAVEPGAANIAFRLLGYRLWWALRMGFAPAQSQMRGLVVIGGAPRSGTTLLRTVLGRHRAICSLPETTVFLHRISSPADIAERTGWQARDIAAWQRASRSQAEFIERFASAALAASGKTVWAEKTPHNVARFGFVRRRFPHAKLVHIIRDGRDVVCSLRREPFSKVRGAAADSPSAARQCAAQWCASVTAGLRFRGNPAYHELHYEELVRTPEPVLRRLMAFLAVDWDDALLAVQDGAGRDAYEAAGRDAYEAKAAGQIFKGSIGRWQRDLSAADRDAIRALMQPVLQAAGYSAQT